MSLKIPNHYATLNCNKQSTDDEVKVAYSLLARQHHPDLYNNDPTHAAKMAEVNVAYNVLKNKKERAKYDKMLGLLGHQCGKCSGFGATRKQKGFTKVTYVTCHECKGSGTKQGADND